ncbi:hypothetical protein LR007_00485 [candidate division NPL-UPA2 bacterium]|nr:hypothetical protein [candidate division NPL-UPA2 bacterium]
MVRTQIQLKESQYRELKQRAFYDHVSLSGEIRRLLDKTLKPSKTDYKRKRAFSFVGVGKSRLKDIAVHHDDYLAGLRP